MFLHDEQQRTQASRGELGSWFRSLAELPLGRVLIEWMLRSCRHAIQAGAEDRLDPNRPCLISSRRTWLSVRPERAGTWNE